MQAHLEKNSTGADTPILGSISPRNLRRNCACGGSAGLTDECPKCQSGRLIGAAWQPKLRVSEPGDAYETEANRVADQVLGISEPTAAVAMVYRPLSEKSGVAAIQRQKQAAGEEPGSSPEESEGSSAQADESRCPSWRADPESISKRVAETYVRNDMTPPSQATVERINCEPPVPNGNYGCYVHFSGGLVIRVIVRATDVVVGTGPGPFTTLTPPPGTPLCFYDYTCPDGQLVLTKRECRSARPAGPPAVAQRSAAVAGKTQALATVPQVNEAVSSAGQPLDESTREFFSARFGHDFSQVRVHADAAAAQSARSIHALAYTVGRDIFFDAGRYDPKSLAGRHLLAHELTHVVQQGSAGAKPALIQRQPNSDEPRFRDLPILLEKLELDMGKNLEDYGHHLYQAATLHPDEPDLLKDAFSRFALGKNMLQTTFKFAGFKADTANKLALGTGVLFKSLTLIREGELTLDFQIDLGRGLKLETNLNLGVDPKNMTDVRKAGVNIGLVRRF